jgi:hypothetical protein
MDEAPRIDPNTAWWTLRETVRELNADTSSQEQRERAVALLQLLAQWLHHGGDPPQV